jgi:hypothetical protein
LKHHAYKVETQSNRIIAIVAFNTQTVKEKRFAAIILLIARTCLHGVLTGADYTVQEMTI